MADRTTAPVPPGHCKRCRIKLSITRPGKRHGRCTYCLSCYPVRRVARSVSSINAKFPFGGNQHTHKLSLDEIVAVIRVRSAELRRELRDIVSPEGTAGVQLP